MGLRQTDLKQTLKKYLPALAFVGGFIWDALTIGRRVNALDLLILTVYLIATVFIIKHLVKKTTMLPPPRWRIIRWKVKLTGKTGCLI
jgi:preprotein translocase subunit SecY